MKINRHTLAYPGIVFALTAAAFLPFSCTKSQPMSGATAWVGGQAFEALAVEGVTAGVGRLVVTIPGSGTVMGVREAAVVSQTQGVITSVSFSTGDRVKEGQVLLRMDDRLASFNLKRAKDQLDSAVLDLKARQILAESGGASASDVARAQSAESAARSQYEQAKKSFDDSTILSPISGVVASRDAQVTEGNVLSVFSPVARIVDNSSFRVGIGVGEREVGRLRPGLKTRVFVPSAFGETPVDAEVVAVGGGADPQTGSFPVIVGFENRWGDLVKSGMSARVEVVPEEGNPLVIVPLSALVRRGDSYALFVAENDKAKIRTVDVGSRNGVRAEILRGVSEGETIIVSALSRLVDGTPVSVTLRGGSASRE